MSKIDQAVAATRKRREKNVKNMIEFFKNKTKDGLQVLVGLKDPFSVLTPEDALKIIELFNKDNRAFEAFATYARRFKQASTELSVEDLTEVHNLMQVIRVMES